MLALLTDETVAGEYAWFGPQHERAEELRRRWRADALLGPAESFLAVIDNTDGGLAGWVTWRAVGRSGSFEIGIGLLPRYRGRGLGTAAQELLVEQLFQTTPAHRLQAATETGNTAERKALEHIGFRLEGVLRESALRAGQWRDGVIYGMLRGERGSGGRRSADADAEQDRLR